MVFSVGRVVCVLKYHPCYLYGVQCEEGGLCTKISPMLPVWCSVWGGWSVLKYHPCYLYGVQCGEGGLCTKISPLLPVWCSVWGGWSVY